MAHPVAWLILGAFDPKLWYIPARCGRSSGQTVTYLCRRWLPSVWVAAVAKNPALSQLWLTVLGALLVAQLPTPSASRCCGAFVEQLLVGKLS